MSTATLKFTVSLIFEDDWSDADATSNYPQRRKHGIASQARSNIMDGITDITAELIGVIVSDPVWEEHADDR